MNYSRVSLRDLEYLVCVADQKNFGRAADKCGVSQPALSTQIQKVEKWLGVQIFERSTRRVFETPMGAKIVTQARRVLEEASTLVDMSKLIDPLSGELKLGAISTLGPYLFPKIISELRQTYPQMTLRLSEGLTRDLVHSLMIGDLDAVLLTLPVADASVRWQRLFQEPLLLATPIGHSAGSAGGPSWDQLPANERLILTDGHCLRDQALSACASVEPRQRLATSIETLKYMVAAGEGCTLLPALAVAENDPVTTRLLPGRKFSRDVALAWRHSDGRGDDFIVLSTMISNFISEGAFLPVSDNLRAPLTN